MYCEEVTVLMGSFQINFSHKIRYDLATGCTGSEDATW